MESSKSETAVILIHGAWAEGSSWSAVIEQLQAEGYKVTAPQFPLTSLADDVARLRQVLALQDGPTVLVGPTGGQIADGAQWRCTGQSSVWSASPLSGSMKGSAGPPLARVLYTGAGHRFVDARGWSENLRDDCKTTSPRALIPS
jgi:hypothetical protein